MGHFHVPRAIGYHSARASDQECQRECNYVGEDNEVYLCPDLKLTCFAYPNRTSQRSPRPALRLLPQLRRDLRRRGSVTLSGAYVGGPRNTRERHQIRKKVRCCGRRGPRSDSETETEPESSDDESTQARGGLSIMLVMISVGTRSVRSLEQLLSRSARPPETRRGLAG